MIKTVATRCHILWLKCIKFDLGWGSALDPAGELTVLPQTLYLDLRVPTSKGRGAGREKGRGQRGDVRRKGREGEREGDGCVMALGDGCP